MSQSSDADQKELLALQTLRASLEAFRSSTATLATDLETHQQTLQEASKVGEGWRTVLSEQGASGPGK